MAKRGRKPKPRSETVWIPEELIDLVFALKANDMHNATVYFAKWVDSQNKHDVNLEKVVNQEKFNDNHKNTENITAVID